MTFGPHRPKSAKARPLAAFSSGSRRGHFVTFERAIPAGGEQAVGIALAQAIGAFAAHPRCEGGTGDAAGAGELGQEGELAPCGPAVAAEGSGLVHPPAWITKAML